MRDQPDGRRLQTGAFESPDESVRVWDLATGRVDVPLVVASHPLCGVWLGDSRHFAIGDNAGAVRLYRLPEQPSVPEGGHRPPGPPVVPRR